MHVVRDTSGRIWLIDHGVCFHREWKLRTVIWDFAGEALPQEVLRVLENFTNSKPGVHLSSDENFFLRMQDAFSRLLTEEEIKAVEFRAVTLHRVGRFPLPGPGLSVPWPVWA
jgi:hypothetical protein